MISLLSLVSGIRETTRAARENDDQFVIFGLRDQRDDKGSQRGRSERRQGQPERMISLLSLVSAIRQTTRAARENDDQFVIFGFSH